MKDSGKECKMQSRKQNLNFKKCLCFIIFWKLKGSRQSGKTTLLKLLIGTIQPTKGLIKVGFKLLKE